MRLEVNASSALRAEHLAELTVLKAALAAVQAANEATDSATPSGADKAAAAAEAAAAVKKAAALEAGNKKLIERVTTLVCAPNILARLKNSLIFHADTLPPINLVTSLLAFG